MKAVVKKMVVSGLVTSSIIFSSIANAIYCSGTVTYVVDNPSGNCPGGMAFMTSGTDNWICTPSKNGNAIVLTAYAMGKTLEVDMKGALGSCANNPGYLTPYQIFIRAQ